MNKRAISVLVCAMYLLTGISFARGQTDLWQIDGGAMAWEDGVLVNTSLEEVGTATYRPEKTDWESYTLQARVRRVRDTQENDGFFGIVIRSVGEGKNTMVMLRNKGLAFVNGAGSEAKLRPYDFKEGVSYDVRVQVKGRFADVHIRPADGKVYSYGGRINGLASDQGAVGIRVFRYHGALESFSVTQSADGDGPGQAGEAGLKIATPKALLEGIRPRPAAPKAAQEGEQVPDTLQFANDFTGGMSFWKPDGNTFSVIDGRLTSLSAASTSRAVLQGNSAKWDDFTMTVRFKKLEENPSASFVSFGVRAEKTPAVTFMLRPKAVNYRLGDGAETGGTSFVFETGVEYDLKITAKGGTVSAYAKTARESIYHELVSLADVPGVKGTFTLGSYNARVAFDDFAVHTERAAMGFSKKLYRTEAGSTLALALPAAFGTPFEWASDNPQVASVDKNGRVFTYMSGSATITVKTENGADSCDLVVYESVQGVYLNKNELQMTVGVNEQLTSTVLPAMADGKNVVWETSDESVVGLFGKAPHTRALIPKAPGQAVVKVTTVSGGYSEECLVTVLPPTADEMGRAAFAPDGTAYEIPPYVYGIHENDAYQRVGRVQTAEEFNAAANAGLLKEIRAKSVRGAYEGFDRLAGTVDKRSLDGGKAPLTLEEIFRIPNMLNIPRAFAVNMEDTNDEIIETVKAMRKVTKQPLFIEYGNEGYAMMYQRQIPTVEDYVARAKDLYPRIKAIDPTIKVGIVILGYVLETAILNDANNFIQHEENMEYTQGTRAATWNKVIAENPDCYDAVIVHQYASVQSFDELTRDSMMRFLLMHNAFYGRGWERQALQFPGKEFWLTEYGDLPTFFWNPNMDERARLQYMKSPGSAIGYMDYFFEAVKSRKITLSHFHYLNDSQGFGIAQSGTKLPNYYGFKEIGRLVDENTHMHDLNMTGGGARAELMVMNAARETVTLPDAKAWGFGDGAKIREFAFLNTTDQPITVRVEGYALRKTWAYGGREEALPDFLANPAEKWTDPPVKTILPEAFTDTAYEKEIILKPYSMTLAAAQK